MSHWLRYLCAMHMLLSICITFNFVGFSKVKYSFLSPFLDFFKFTRQTNVNLYHANIITTWFRIYLHRTNVGANIYEQVARRSHRPQKKCSFFSAMHFCQKLLTRFIFNEKYSITFSFSNDTECVVFILSLLTLPPFLTLLINLYIILSLRHEGIGKNGSV